MAIALTTTDGSAATAGDLTTLGDLTDYCQEELNDPDATLLILIKKWCNAVKDEAENFGRRPPFRYASATLTTTADIAYVAAPSNMVRLVRVSSTTQELTPAIAKRIVSGTDTGVPTEVWYSRTESKVYFYPVPGDEYSYTIEYQQESDVLADSGDTCLIPKRYLYVLYPGLNEFICRYHKDYSGASSARFMFNDKMLQMLKSEKGNAGPERMKSYVEVSGYSGLDQVAHGD